MVKQTTELIRPKSPCAVSLAQEEQQAANVDVHGIRKHPSRKQSLFRHWFFCCAFPWPLILTKRVSGKCSKEAVILFLRVLKLACARVESSILDRLMKTEGGTLGAWESIETVIDGGVLRLAPEVTAEAYEREEKFEAGDALERAAVGAYEELTGLERREAVSLSLATFTCDESFAACRVSILISILARRC